MSYVSSPYRPLLLKPGARQFALAGLLARLPISTFNISAMLMIQLQYDRWEVAGRVVAVGVGVWALQTLPTARWVDRKGQRMMIPLTVLFVIGTTILIATAMTRGPEPLLWLGIGIASLSGPLGSLTRARWSHILDNDDDIHTAFSLEGALDEVLFVAGPAVVTALAYSVHPASGLLLAAAGMVGGITLLLAQKETEPPAQGEGDSGGLGFKVPPAIFAVAAVAIALGAMFGALDISTVAFAKELGHEKWAGLVIGVISSGSFLGGLAYGARRWRTPLWKRLVIASVALAAGFVVLANMPNLWLYTAFGFVAGMGIAPLITSQDSVAQRVVKQSQLTEGMAWLRIGLGAGVALGSWLSGRFIDQLGHGAGLQVMAWSAVAIAVLAIAGSPWVRRDTEAADRRRGIMSEPGDMEPPVEAHGDQPPIPPMV
ncbi:MFS transporter [Demequina sp. TTPB684]|uniref:MFS transporter n=1 Tax=unclassified Demequina TaxID=2620311 RepID=UPI001CF475F3|nr:MULTISPECIES: MFS transporter [unclassified Demequina]MCB2413701.1 MFS transporter [Demequina sp. TTPB684]UPU87763.1 MFS transporter [Demequina sp. TMPB413]